MKPDHPEQRNRLIISWSPVLLLISLGLMALTSLSAPVSASHIGFMTLIALPYSVIAMIYWKKPSFLLAILGAIILVVGETFIRNRFFPNESGWMRPVQFAVIIFVIFFGILSVFRLRGKYWGE